MRINSFVIPAKAGIHRFLRKLVLWIPAFAGMTVCLLSPKAYAGGGTATLVPTVVPEGGVVTSTLTFTVPVGGFSTGGRIQINLPTNWGPALQTVNSGQFGYVTAITTAAATLGLAPVNTSTSSAVMIRVVSGFLVGGARVQVILTNIHPACPQPSQFQSAWEILTATSTIGPVSDIASQPVQNYALGPAQSIGYNPWNPVTVAAGQSSPALVLQSNDGCGQPVPVSAPTVVNLQGFLADQQTGDTGAQFANSSSFATPITSVLFSSGSTTATFYYKTSTVGNNLWILGSYLLPGATNTQPAWLSITSLAAAPSFSGLSVDTGSPVPGQTSVTITPDGTGVNNSAYVRFVPSVSTLQWHVAISSTGFATTVFDQWGFGNPQGTISWGGQNFNNALNGTTAATAPQVVPNGTYTVKVEIPGIVTDTSLSVVVNTSQISGNVTLGGLPVQGAIVNAQGATGPGYSSTVSDINGNYVLNGLHAGTQYNLYANYTSTVTQALSAGQINNVAAPSSNQNFALTTPAIIEVAATATSSSSVTLYGNLNVYTANYSQNYFGNIQLAAGALTSNNGSFTPSSWTVIAVQPGSYTVQLTLNGYGSPNQSVTVVAGQTASIVMPLTAMASVYGMITLPAPAAVPLFVSVAGTPVGSNSPTIFGGASFNVGQSTAIYSLFAVAPGTYTITAQPQGFVALSQSNVVVGSANIGDPVNGGLNFSGFSTGGIISGSITINGDTSNQTNLTVWLSAYSPTTGDNEGTQVTLSTSSTSTSASYQIQGLGNSTYVVYPPYLQGFQAVSTNPATINAVNNQISILNFVMNQNSGAITGSIKLPGGASDYNNVHLSVQGMNQKEVNATGSTYTLGHLGTGFYNLTATYLTSGAQVVSQVQLTNGQTFTLNLDLSAPTYSVSGTVSIQSGFSILGASGTSVAINTFPELLANATNQALYIGETPDGGTYDCTNTPPTVVSTVRVEAFPKYFNNFNSTNRTGFNNCFPIGGYTYALIDSSGNYTISGLSAGVWEIDVYPYFDNGQAPDVATVQQDITVGGNVTGVNFPLSDGYSISGTISLPPGVTDTRALTVQILSSLGDTVQTAQLNLGTESSPASSVAYQFSSLPSGQFALLVQDSASAGFQNSTKYVAQPIQFTIASANQTNVNVSMGFAASMVGQIGIAGTNADGSANLTLITPNNITLLPTSLQINAQSDPYVAGGFGQAQPGSSGGVGIDANNQFHIYGLVPGTYDVIFSQNSFGAAVQGAGAINLANYTVGSVAVGSGQTVNLGTITLTPGISLSGTITDQSGNPLSNITVQADPATDQHGDEQIQTYTDGSGNFTFNGLNPNLKIYNFVAAPYPQPGSQTQVVPYGQVSKLAVDITQIPPPALNFTLPPATASLTGRIVTADGGSLSFPDSGEAGYPEAAIYLLQEGTLSANNPLGNENATALDGSFNLTDLVAGVYDISVESLGYQPYRVTGVQLGNGAIQSLGTITLQKGPELNATLTNADGSPVNTNQVQTAVAVTPDLTSIIFGQVASDANTNNILSIKFSGFTLSPSVYNVLLFDNQNNITTPPQGQGLVFVSSSEVLSLALTYSQSAPFAYCDAVQSGNAVSLTYYFSRPLRNQGNDQDPTQWITLNSGKGTLSNYVLSGDRRQLSVLYTPAAGEQNATFTFSEYTVDLNPATGTQFLLTKATTLLLGQKATVETNISPALGGSVSLAQENDPANVYIPSNALLSSTGAAVGANTSYDFTFTETNDASSIAGSSFGNRSAALAQLMAKGAPAYVSEAYAAMSVARTNTTINPLSSFYSVLLPAGLSHSLNVTAYLTLSYNTTADPTQINVYYFNGTQYLIENNQRTVDLVNHTITVGVNHFSTFVVLENNAPVVTVAGGAGSEPAIDVFNFPNPFNLQSKTETLNRGGSATSMNTNGTIIRYFIPASEAGAAASIDIYDIVGEKVCSLDLGAPAGNTYNYIPWNGQNSSGHNVASGVYIGVLKVGGNKAFFKMAVIK